jgi:CHAT domain-containing protein
MDCRLRSGGWPYQALAVTINDRTYLAESIPAAYPVVERTVGVLSGKLTNSLATQQGAVSGEIKRLESTLANANYSAGDLSSYRNLLVLAQYDNIMGDDADAERRYSDALDLEHKLNPGGSGDECFLYMHIALELSNQERFNLADAMFERSQSLLQKSMEPAADEARLLGYRAAHMANQRKNKEALELARKATAARRELVAQYGYAGDKRSESGKLSSLGAAMQISSVVAPLSQRATTAFGDMAQGLFVEASMLVELGRLDEADHLLDEALKILNQEPRAPKPWLPKIRLLQARMAELRGNLQRADSLLQLCIDAQRSLFIDSRTEGLAQLALGRVYAAEGRLPQALDAFHKGFEIVNKTQFAVGLQETAPFLRICLEEMKQHPEQREKLFSEMFESAQIVRGTMVAQTIAMTMARLASGQDEAGKSIRDLQDACYERDKLRERLTLAQADPNSLSAQISELEQSLKASNSRIEDLERQVQAAAPNYNQILDKKVPVHDVLDALRADEAPDQILVGKDASFVLFADHDGITGYEVKLTEKQAAELVGKMRYAVHATDQLRPFLVEDSYALYEKIFGPVKDRVARAKHFITVPSGPLLSLPFGILVVKKPGHFSRAYYSEISWMAARQGITIAPSVQSFVNLRTLARPSKAALPFIGFGDFAPHRDDVSAALKALDLPDTCRDEAALFVQATCNKLPNSANELRQVAAALGQGEGSLVMGDSFSAATVEKKDLTNYRIVYFSTHALLPSKLRCFREPALIVSKSPSDSQGASGLLTTSEIAELKMDAELVVLSACDTGGPAGKTGGESLSGLARSFFYAGARSMLVSHWELLDKPSADLLATCFKRWATGDLSFAEALRDGQAALIKNPNTSHPMIWGALSLVGDGSHHLRGEKVANR